MRKIVALIIALLICFSNVYGASQSPSYSIKINIASQVLRLFSMGTMIKEYPIAVGKTTSKTPTGNFKVINKLINPYWNNHGKIVAPGPKNPLGIRWMGINAPNGVYGIHGNNVPTSIGTVASGGCVRMNNRDVEELYSIISVGTPVQIVYENVELRNDKYSEATVLILYPDVYKRKSAMNMIKSLSASNKTIHKELTDRALKLSNTGVKSTTVIGDSTSVLLNGQYMTSAAYVQNEQVYVYYLAALECLGLDQDTVTELNIPVVEKDNCVYINVTQAVPKLGGVIKFDKNSNNVNLNVSIIKLNGRYLTTYKGNSDKTYEINTALLKPFGTFIDDKSTQTVDLKELSKKNNWALQIDSLYKTMDINIPTVLKYADKSIPTLSYDDSIYVNADAVKSMSGAEGKEFSVYTIGQKKYYEVYELLKDYEYQINKYFTEIEVVNSEKGEV